MIQIENQFIIISKSALPITNSLSDLGQLSLSYDGKKLVFAALYNLGYNIFMLNNPFEIKLETDSLKYTDYMKSIVSAKISNEEKNAP